MSSCASSEDEDEIEGCSFRPDLSLTAQELMPLDDFRFLRFAANLARKKSDLAKSIYHHNESTC